MTGDDATFLENQVNPPTPHPYSNMGGWGKGCSTEKTNNKNMINIEDDDYIDEGFTDYRFNEILFELEANGTILKQWESGAPIDNAPQQKPKKNYEKGETIQ